MTKTALLTCYNNSGFCLFPLKGKVPAYGQTGWQNTPYDLGVDADLFPDNFGVVLGEEDLVIDIDPRNFEPDDKPHQRLFEDIRIAFKNISTLTVVTGSGGMHIYFKIPKGTKVKKKNKSYKGIDFLSKGCYVVGAGSLHPDTKKPYHIINGDPNTIAMAPEALIELVKSTVVEREHTDKINYTDSEYDVKGYIEYLTTAPPAVEGDNGDDTTYKVACQGRNLGLSEEKTFELMLEYYNPRCVPAWSPQDLQAKVQNAYSFAQGEVGQGRAESQFEEVEVKTVIKWDLGNRGSYLKTLRNVVNFFQMPNNKLFETVAYDEFAGKVCVVKPLPWHKTKHVPEGLMWTDDDSIQCRYFLGHQSQFDVATALIHEGVLKSALHNKFHPVRDFMNELVWDGEARIDSWLSMYCGAVDNAYVREVGKNALLQLVARVYQPGCKADHVLVLEGAQGTGKSTICSIMGGKWYADIVIDPHSRDTVEALRGKLLVEFSEMDVTRKAEATALKAFITRQEDRVRLAYGRTNIDLKRQCSFWGTVNPTALNDYLLDPTGGRRWWPVKLNKINLDALDRDRDQLLAEAVQRKLKGEAFHIVDKKILRMAEAEQKKRQASDPWAEKIREFLDTNELAREEGYVTVMDIWEFGLKGSSANLTRHQSARIHTVMKELGWRYNAYAHPLTKTKMKAFRLFEDPTVNTQGKELLI